MGTPSGLYLDISGVTLTDPDGGVIAVGEVTELEIDRSGDVIEAEGDDDEFPELVQTVGNRRVARITTGDVFAALRVKANTPYALAATINDLRNAAGSGSLAVSLTGAVLVEGKARAAANAVGKSTLGFLSQAPDGETDPFTVTQNP